MGEMTVRIGDTAREKGLRVRISSTLGIGVSGVIARDADGWLVRANRHESRERQRFTIAVLVAHFTMHRSALEAAGYLKVNVLYGSVFGDAFDRPAVREAMRTLLPKNAFKADIQETGSMPDEDQIERLASRWGVTKALVETRLAQLAA